MTTATETTQVLKEMDYILRLLEVRIPANPESLNAKLNGIKLVINTNDQSHPFLGVAFCLESKWQSLMS
jgi:hypothetical protein